MKRGLMTSLRTMRVALAPPELRRVVIAFGIASMIEAAAWLAVGVYVYERFGAAAVGVVGLAILLPAAVFAPAAAALADRHRRQRILFASYATQFLSFTLAAIALGMAAPPWVVVALAIVASLALTPVRPAQGALLPTISRAPSDLTAANVALTTMRNVGLFVGPLVAGIVLRTGGPAAVLASTALLAALAAGLLVGVHAEATRPGSHHTSTATSVVEGVRLLRGEHRVALVIGLFFGKHVVMGAIRTFVVVVALGLLRMGDGGPGALSAALGIGGAVGAGTSVLLVGRRRLSPALIAGALLLGLPVIAIGLSPEVAWALVAMGFAGVGRSLLDVAGRTLLGRVSPDAAMARFLGILDGSSYAGLAVGSVVAAVLTDLFGVRAALVVVGTILPALVLVLVGPLLRIDRGPLISRDRLRLILGVRMFEPLPPESVERLATHLETVVADAGATPIVQGEIGDRFYIMESGEAVAEVDGKVVAAYAHGEGFGEIALLHDVPRTATVRMTTPGRLVTLDREHFLDALGDAPTSMIEAERLAADRLSDTASKRDRPR